jgi:hypothetical protein
MSGFHPFQALAEGPFPTHSGHSLDDSYAPKPDVERGRPSSRKRTFWRTLLAPSKRWKYVGCAARHNRPVVTLSSSLRRVGSGQTVLAREI